MNWLPYLSNQHSSNGQIGGIPGRDRERRGLDHKRQQVLHILI